MAFGDEELHGFGPLLALRIVAIAHADEAITVVREKLLGALLAASFLSDPDTPRVRRSAPALPTGRARREPGFQKGPLPRVVGKCERPAVLGGRFLPLPEPTQEISARGGQ